GIGATTLLSCGGARGNQGQECPCSGLTTGVSWLRGDGSGRGALELPEGLEGFEDFRGGWTGGRGVVGWDRRMGDRNVAPQVDGRPLYSVKDFRRWLGRMLSCSRYLATVRRATAMP